MHAPASSPAPASLRIAVLIPAFKQPGLLGEAIVSALRQSEAATVLVVDDGCPMQETRDVALSFSRAYPDRVFVVRKPNGGLSSARNAGIAYALKAWPQLEAVMFLDADNRIAPDFLARAMAAFDAAPAEIGWLYPDIDMIGLDESSSTRGEFSLLALIDWNYCDAGSVVRRSLLDCGLRFDESLRLGFEDWDFWLQAAQAGFRGQHLPNAGFGYRLRGESMVSAASRKREIIIAEMNRKRRAFLRPRNILELEAREAPRFAIFRADEDFVQICSDPSAKGQRLSLGETAERLRQFAAAPGEHPAPAVFCFASRLGLATVADALILASLFWYAQVQLRSKSKFRIFLSGRQGVEVRLAPGDASRADDEAALIFLPASVLVEPSASETATADLDIELPEAASGEASFGGAQEPMLHFMAQMRADTSTPTADWRRDYRPPRNDLLGLYQRVCDVGAPLPLMRPPESQGEIGFVIPIHSFGGVEKVVANQARVLRRHGYRPHLFITSGTEFLLTSATRESFVSVNLLMNPAFDRSVRGYDYFGAPMSGFEREGGSTERLDALGLLCGMDVVIDTHALGAHGLAARLRGWGVTTMTALHVVDRDPLGAPIGNPHIALAYEHAYDRILVISENLRAWCLAHGLPESKILLLPNAPSYPPRDSAEAVREKRAARSPGPLRVLFLGRLDAQKGLDRLAKIIAATRGASFEWRVIGKPVRGDAALDELNLGVAVEPPLHEPEELDAAFDWADVLVVPSRFEGAPLTILEARRRGVVVVAANVGAVAETMAEGGYMTDPSQADSRLVAEFIAILKTLARDPDLLGARARAVLDHPPPDWEETTAPLLAFLQGADASK